MIYAATGTKVYRLTAIYRESCWGESASVRHSVSVQEGIVSASTNSKGEVMVESSGHLSPLDSGWKTQAEVHAAAARKLREIAADALDQASKLCPATDSIVEVR